MATATKAKRQTRLPGKLERLLVARGWRLVLPVMVDGRSVWAGPDGIVIAIDVLVRGDEGEETV